MTIIPKTVLFFACEDARVDEENGAMTLVRPIHVVRLPQGADYPYAVDRFFFYGLLANGLGDLLWHVELRDEDDELLGRTESASIHFDANNRFDGIEFLAEIATWELSAPGLYQFSLRCDQSPEPMATAELRFIEG